MSARANARQYAITVYIHPDSGPILPMQIDMMQVEIVALRADAATRSEERVDEVINQIRQCFPALRPESQRREIAAMLARMENLKIFSGVVLRMAGEIEEESPAVTQRIEDLSEEIASLRSEAVQLRERLENARMQAEILRGKLHEATSANQQLVQQHAAAERQIRYLQAQLMQAGQQGSH